MPGSEVSLSGIQSAAARIAGRVGRTPCTHSRVLSQLTGAEVWLKFENFQFTASFKERGALNKLLSLSASERAAGVAAMSAGNHAQAVAHHATQLGMRSVIVMPVGTPFTKVRNTRELGGEVILHGETLADAHAYLAEELIGRRGMTLVHPYDDVAIIEGQGTVALEMLEQAPQLDTLLVPIGGGGLISGMAVAAHALRPDLQIVGVEATGYRSAYSAVQGDVSLVTGGPTIAEGIAVANVGTLALPLIRAHVHELVRVDEPTLERAVGLLATVEKVITEGAGAAGLAALLSDATRFRGRKVGLVLSGGNIDTRLLASVLLRQLVHESRLVWLIIGIADRPGFLAGVAGRIGDSGGNIVQVHHERLQSTTHAKYTALEVLVETQDGAHSAQIVADLETAGYTVSRGAGRMDFE